MGGPLAEATSRLPGGRVRSEKHTAGCFSGPHFHMAEIWGLNIHMQKGDQSVCRKRRVADGELRQRRRQGEQADFGQADNDFLSDYVQSESLRGRGPLWSHPDGFGGLASIFHYYVDYRSDSAVQDLAVEDNVTEDQHSPGQTAIPSDPECALERAAEDGETRRLRKRLLSPEEGEEGEEEDEEPALHSCDSCRQVFESLSDLTEHKINQCQLTDCNMQLRDPTVSRPPSGNRSLLQESPLAGPNAS
ncbi:hypothetical protein PAMA_004996 [Pampus argenteus]